MSNILFSTCLTCDEIDEIGAFAGDVEFAGNWFPLFRMGQMVHFEFVHLLFLGIDLAPLRMKVRVEVLVGVFLLYLGTWVKEELPLDLWKLSMVGLVGASRVSYGPW